MQPDGQMDGQTEGCNQMGAQPNNWVIIFAYWQMYETDNYKAAQMGV